MVGRRKSAGDRGFGGGGTYGEILSGLTHDGAGVFMFTVVTWRVGRPRKHSTTLLMVAVNPQILGATAPRVS